MNLRVIFSPNAWEDYETWVREEPRIARRIVRLIADIRRDPHSGDGIGKPELLKGTFSGYASRRIDGEHRLVYRVRGDDLEIAACFSHYTAK